MVGAPAAAAAVKLERRLPRLAVGLHLTLVDGEPALPRTAVPDLVDERGRFRANMAALRRRDVSPGPRPRANASGDPRPVRGLPRRGPQAGPRYWAQAFSPASHDSLGITGNGKGIWGFGGSGSFRAVDDLSADRRRPPALFGLSLGPVGAPSARATLVGSDLRARSSHRGRLERFHDAIAACSDFVGAAPSYRYKEELAALTSPHLRCQIPAAGVASGAFSEPFRKRDEAVRREAHHP